MSTINVILTTVGKRVSKGILISGGCQVKCVSFLSAVIMTACFTYYEERVEFCEVIHGIVLYALDIFWLSNFVILSIVDIYYMMSLHQFANG